MFAAARYYLLTLLVVLSPLQLDSVSATEPHTSLIFGIHPYLPPSEIKIRFQPLADHLGKVLEQPLEIRIGRNYEEQIQAVGTNQVDIAFMGPAQYVKLRDAYGPRPLLARLEVNGKPELFGAVIVRADSPLHALTDLKGRSFAFGDPDSTMSHIVPEAMLADAGIPLPDLGEYKFLGAHKNVVFGVLSGDFDAGAVKMEVFDEYADRGLRLLVKSPAISEHLLVTRADLPTAQVDKLRQALLNLKNLPEGRRILQSITKNMTAFVPVDDSDYDSLRMLMRPQKAGD